MTNLEDIKKLRESTGAGMADCKKALEEASGDFEKAVEFLRKKGAATSAKRAEKAANEGYVATYNHGGRIASMVELSCETDFVSRNSDFQELAKDLAMQVAAGNPGYLKREDVPKKVIDEEKRIELEKATAEGKPKEIAEKIVAGKMDKYLESICLLEQSFIKDPDIKINDLLNEKIAAIGEKVEIKRFVRYEVGK